MCKGYWEYSGDLIVLCVHKALYKVSVKLCVELYIKLYIEFRVKFCVEPCTKLRAKLRAEFCIELRAEPSYIELYNYIPLFRHVIIAKN